MSSLPAFVLLLGLFSPPRTEGLPFEKNETVQRTFMPSGSAPAEVEVDNVTGSIEVVGYEGESVELVVHETFGSHSQEELEVAQREVRLLVSQEENRIRLFVDGPFRERDSFRRNGPESHRYRAQFDFQLRVPRRANLDLKTVNDGEIRVDGVEGRFDVHNVNGGISMTGLSGSGRAYAVNGAVSVVFAENPTGESYFGSLNGDVSVVLREDLSARLMVKTFNGDVYTDFPTTYVRELPPLVLESRRGKRVYKSSGFFGLRVGSGGPALEFDAFNGDIRILKRGFTGQD